MAAEKKNRKPALTKKVVRGLLELSCDGELVDFINGSTDGDSLGHISGPQRDDARAAMEWISKIHRHTFPCGE